jgi:hypothetical protein
MKVREKIESRTINRVIRLCYLSAILSLIALVLNLINSGVFKWISTKIVSCF